MATNVYQMVTDRIISEMEKGIIPWHKGWTCTNKGAISYVTQKPYSFLNQLLLGEAGEYLTFNQCKSLGGTIKKGSKSKFVVLFTFVDDKKNKTIDEDGVEHYGRIPILKYYNVFHINDCEGVKSKARNAEANENFQPIELAEQVINDYTAREKKLKVLHKNQNRAYYSPSSDTVVLPLKEQFKIEEEYYSTAFHELTHSTIPAYRCNRKNDNAVAAFGSEDYSREELVAELGSAMLCNHCGIAMDKTIKNQAAYIQSWLKALKDDMRMIVWASSRAETAAKYILNINEK